MSLLQKQIGFVFTKLTFLETAGYGAGSDRESSDVEWVKPPFPGNPPIVICVPVLSKPVNPIF